MAGRLDTPRARGYRHLPFLAPGLFTFIIFNAGSAVYNGARDMITLLLTIIAVSITAADGRANRSPSPRDARPEITVSSSGWGVVPVDEIEKVLHSAAAQLVPHFPGRKWDRMVILRSTDGPITLYRRGAGGEIIVKLDVSTRRWPQFAFQFAHELGHVLCGLQERRDPNKWFEESICEAASLFTLRGMARRWRKSPPDPDWKGHAASLRRYADDRLLRFRLSPSTTLAAWYRKNSETLRKSPYQRDKNGIVATAILALLEAHPEHWKAINFLNAATTSRPRSFREYLGDWRRRTPARHRRLVTTIAKLFEIRLE